MEAMTHREIEENEIIEGYVRQRLTPDERRAFQEHYFSCDECFDRVQTEARFIASVRDASATGAFAPATESRKAAASSWGSGWWRPVLAFSTLAGLLIVAAVAWFWLSRGQSPKPAPGVEQARQASSPIPSIVNNNQVSPQPEQPQLSGERAGSANQQPPNELERKKNQRPNQDLVASVSIPTVTLESSRDSGSAAQLNIPADAKNVLLLIPVEAGNRFASFTVERSTKERVLIDSITGARPNRSGSLAVTLPAARLGSGDYRIRLYGVNRGQRELLAEYDLRVIKQ
jgi:hypothetical protein